MTRLVVLREFPTSRSPANQSTGDIPHPAPTTTACCLCHRGGTNPPRRWGCCPSVGYRKVRVWSSSDHAGCRGSCRSEVSTPDLPGTEAEDYTPLCAEQR